MASHGVARSGVRERTGEQKRQDIENIRAYRELENQIRAHTVSGNAPGLALFQLTTQLLRLNPEYYTIWNVRRHCLVSGMLSGSLDTADAQGGRASADGDILQAELAFTVPLLTRFPKCYWIWNYRRWVLAEFLRRAVPTARAVWEAELGLASKMLSKDQRNFHGWGYRRAVVAELEGISLGGRSMAEVELAYTKRMIMNNFSNFSAWHARSVLVPRVLDERDADDAARATMLAEELAFIRGCLDTGPWDQGLWFYHRFLVSQLIAGHGDCDSRSPGPAPRLAPALTADQRAAYLRHEIGEIKDLLVDFPNMKWIYLSLLEYTTALKQLEQREGYDDGDAHDLRAWLTELRTLDPLRSGRWDDLERELGL